MRRGRQNFELKLFGCKNVPYVGQIDFRWWGKIFGGTKSSRGAKKLHKLHGAPKSSRGRKKLIYVVYHYSRRARSARPPKAVYNVYQARSL